MDRREFLLAAGAAGAALGLPMRASAADPAPRPRKARSMYVDALGAVDGFEEKDGKPVPTQRLIEAIRQRRIDLISMTIADVGNGPDRFQNAAQAVAMWDGMIAGQPALVAKIESVADIRAARAAGKLGLIYNFQDTTALEGDAARVDTFGNLGVKILQLTYNKRNLAGDGCLERSNAGLSDFGREVISTRPTSCSTSAMPASAQSPRALPKRKRRPPSPTAAAARWSISRATPMTPRCGRWPTKAACSAFI